jgi:Plasmid pRiA4b ORF-3-like protein
VTRAPKPTRPDIGSASSAAEAGGAEIVQVKVWVLGISPMVWRRVRVPSTCTLRELHGVIQVAMGWEGIHLYQFCLRSRRCGSWELSASSPDVTLAALRLRKGTRFAYEYDLNIPWRHEVRIEDHLPAEPGKALPVCTGGNGACPPEDCGGPAGFMAGRDAMLSLDALEDLDTMTEILGQVVLERRTGLLDDADTRWRLEDAIERSKAREQAQGHPFFRRMVNGRFRKGEHLDLMHQQC